ncbi:hypothetical protein ACJJIW_08875 [Microbulbifer sp. JMSA004]|uniref:hypothetical protein n=1 Tax=unclassified Microbulbifer TaxID=2619833 RepID=UPI0024ACFF31|nr:hypothetical protein [Microbulbifer sp. VAAF005]WHI45382.1 hypothetical protein P0078_16830 [Microbulbifer sp. VAAF005]
MSKRNIYFPNELIKELNEIVVNQGYDALLHVFKNIDLDNSEYLSIDENEAKLLMRLADIEMSKAILMYPFTDDEEENYDPAHEEKYDDVMMGIYEKTYYYIQSEYGDLES